MAASDIIRLGDKIDIRILQRVTNEDKMEDMPDTYKSQVLDIMENGNFEISMPTDKGKLLLLPLGIRYEFVFYSNGGLYKSIGQIVERYKKDGFYMLQVSLRTPLEKFQRREFFRYSCAMDMSFYMLDEEQRRMESADEIFYDIVEGRSEAELVHGVMVDLSGGGMKFRSEQKLNPGEKIMVMLRLTNDKMDRQFHVLGKLIACVDVRTTSGKNLYESRIKFIIEDNKIREEIIRYIFEEERKIRQKENG